MALLHEATLHYVDAVADALDTAADRLEARATRDLSPEIVWHDDAPVSSEWMLADRATVTSQPFPPGA